MRLIPVHEHPGAADILYQLLLEREDDRAVNISHKSLPSYEQHAAFVANHPYGSWDLIEDEGEIVGSVYLTKPPRPSIAGNEFGIFIFKRYRRSGRAARVVDMIIERNGPGRYLANINPANAKSLALFFSKGFSLCQFTLERIVE